VARAIEVAVWQSVNAVCLAGLTHGACVGHTGLQTTARWRLSVAHVKEDG